MMLEIQGEPVRAYDQANEELMDAFVDLMDTYTDPLECTYTPACCDIVSELIHTIRTYDNMRRRSLINQMQMEREQSCL